MVGVQDGGVTSGQKREQKAFMGGSGSAAAPERYGPNVLSYDTAAVAWSEALPIGNGRLGAMVYGGTSRERIHLNEDSLWSGGPYQPSNHEANQHLNEIRKLIFDGQFDAATELAALSFMGKPASQAAYQTLGDLYIDRGDALERPFTEYRRQLDLDTGVASVRYECSGVKNTRRVVAGRKLIAIHMTSDQSTGYFVSVSSPHPTSSLRVEGGNTLVLSGHNGPSNGVSGALSFEASIQVKTDGRIQDREDHLSVEDSREVTILIAMSTSFKRFDDVSGDPTALNRQSIAEETGPFESILQRASHEHQRLFRRVSLDLGETDESIATRPMDERLELFRSGGMDPELMALYFQYGRYLLISSSQPGSQASNLQGIWNDELHPKWDSKFTVNINTEMNYWPAETTGLQETVEPLFQMVRDLSITGRSTAKEMYGARGWVCHHNTDLWRATAPINHPRYGLWPSGGAWLSVQLWDHYDYSRDKDFLRRLYPILLGACEFFLDTLVQDPESKWMVTNPSVSPENSHGQDGGLTTLCAGPTMDSQILRDLFGRTIVSARILDQIEPAGVNDMLKRLCPTGLGGVGIREWQGKDWKGPEQNHRHISQLYGLFPSHQIDPATTPEMARGARETLLSRGRPSTGWSAGWHLNCWARLRDGKRAYETARALLGPEMSYTNLFDAHPALTKSMAPVFQIDGNFGGTSGYAEMMVQSTPDAMVYLLPALPDEWSSGHLTGIRVRGGWTVSVWWQAGKLSKAVFEAQNAGQQRIHYGIISTDLSLRAGEQVQLDGKLAAA